MTGGFYAPLTCPLNALILRFVIIYIIFFMLENRNWARFKNHKPNTVFTINKIKSHVFLTRNNIIAVSSSSRYEFQMLKVFNIKVNPPNVPQILEFFWQPPPLRLAKCNCDEAFTMSSNKTDCGGIFRGNHEKFCWSLLLQFSGHIPLLLSLKQPFWPWQSQCKEAESSYELNIIQSLLYKPTPDILSFVASKKPMEHLY
ncbi:hypothetical protein KIW84_014180 [Lathyrus oleraceus]|uniref:Uncharacterized protein n=1 Tax=Pisum sativum TaxID=3888 RepID=A0A9D5BMF2_PEA|nr:hypothetical protein KIW84_014180 [Pisum sativum]